MAMGTFPFQWPMDPAASTGLDGSFLPSLLPPPPAGSDDSVAYYGAPQMHAASLPELAAPFPPAATDLAMRRAEEEVAGIRLVHLLMSSAGAIEAGDHALASAQLADANASLAALSTASGIGRVAVHFTDALSRRLFMSPTTTSAPQPPGTDAAFLYHHFYEACPYLKFAHFTANQAILEAFHGCDAVHVVDFSIMQGLQWPALIQALALRPGGPPFLRITGIGPPSPPGRDDLRDVGLRLADLARSVRVRFSFRGVAANTLDEVQPWMLQVAPGEAVAVNSVLQLHRLLADPDDHHYHAPIDAVLDCVASLHPKIFAVVEQEADHNKPGFLDRFTEALFYYSAVFDSLDASGTGSPMAEAYLQREICDIVCNDGAARAERHEPLSRWRDRLARAGLSAVPLGPSALRQARMLVGLSSGEGHSVEEADGCLTLGWHGRPLFSASAWQAFPAVDGAEEHPHNSNTSNVSGSSGGGDGGDSNNSAGSSNGGKTSHTHSSGVVGAGNMFW
ncbi:hypothetical protein ACQ4PT_025378 [Festuca glaucescens]